MINLKGFGSRYGCHLGAISVFAWSAQGKPSKTSEYLV
jgi:hypothetical protein